LLTHFAKENARNIIRREPTKLTLKTLESSGIQFLRPEKNKKTEKIDLYQLRALIWLDKKTWEIFILKGWIPRL